jgi:hypothetical protein
MVVEGCPPTITLTSWVQVAASAFLPGGVAGTTCGTGWRLVCAASFWLVLSLLIAPAVAKITERQTKLKEKLIELRGPVRLYVAGLRQDVRQTERMIRAVDSKKEK